MTEQWVVFTAWNQQRYYGWGTESEADAYCDRLNDGKEVGLYSWHYLDDDDLAAWLDETQGGINLADEAQAHKEWVEVEGTEK